MPDWTGGDGQSTSEAYRHMAETQFRGVSAPYERIALAIAGAADLCALIDRLPPPKRQPNLVLGAVRYLDGPVDADGFGAFLRTRWTDVHRVALTHTTQTNEPNRCATLLPVVAEIEGPVALLEVGASAGLCLLPDRYGYDYPGALVGAGEPRLPCVIEGAQPPVRLPEVVWRAGLDLNPLDVTDDEDVRWLESLVWPEQARRLDTLRAAVATARTDPPRVTAGDLTSDVTALADQAPSDATLVIFHSAVLAYLPRRGRELFSAQVRNIARARPTVWLSNEVPGMVTGTEGVAGAEHAFVLARDGVPVAVTAPHGQWYRAVS